MVPALRFVTAIACGSRPSQTARRTGHPTVEAIQKVGHPPPHVIVDSKGGPPAPRVQAQSTMKANVASHRHKKLLFSSIRHSHSPGKIRAMRTCRARIGGAVWGHLCAMEMMNRQRNINCATNVNLFIVLWANFISSVELISRRPPRQSSRAARTLSNTPTNNNVLPL